MDMKNLSKIWNDSLKVLDNTYVSSIIIFILFLLVSGLFSNINHEVKKLLNNQIVRVIIVLLIIWVAPKNITIAILLAVLYCMSMHGMTLKGLMGLERFENKKEDEDMEKFENEDEEKKEDVENFENDDEEKKDDVENFENEDEKEEVKEDFIPFLTNRDYESNFSSAPQPTSNCLSTDPNQFDLVGEPCSAVATFEGEFNAQGMEPIMGFNLNQTASQTAQPL
jgi:hypothetical protein